MADVNDILEAIWQGVVKAAFDMERHAARIVPVDTGRLRASIRLEIEGNTIRMSANTDYAEFVEFGTVKMRAQPYMRPALHNFVNKFVHKRVREELRKLT